MKEKGNAVRTAVSPAFHLLFSYHPYVVCKEELPGVSPNPSYHLGTKYPHRSRSAGFLKALHEKNNHNSNLRAYYVKMIPYFNIHPVPKLNAAQ